MRISNEKTENGFKFTLESSTEELESIKEVFEKMFKDFPLPMPFDLPSGSSLGDTSKHFERMFNVAKSVFSVEQDILQYKAMLLDSIDKLLKQTRENGIKAQPQKM